MQQHKAQVNIEIDMQLVEDTKPELILKVLGMGCGVKILDLSWLWKLKSNDFFNNYLLVYLVPLA